jgi:hypothetical protein
MTRVRDVAAALAAAALAAAALVACRGTSTDETVASVDTEFLTRGDALALVDSSARSSKTALRDALLDWATDAALYHEALSRGFGLDSAAAASVERYRRHLVIQKLLGASARDQSEITEDDARRYFTVHRSEFGDAAFETSADEAFARARTARAQAAYDRLLDSIRPHHTIEVHPERLIPTP